MSGGFTEPDQAIAEEEALRARFYGLLSHLLAAPPKADTLQALSTLAGDESDIGQALSDLAVAARATSPTAAEQEYTALFIGIGRGELVPFGSYYLTGFLNEKPLARLRDDLARLGLARSEEVREPEDHVASLCEVMCGLITGAFGAPADLAEQRRFFEAHVAPWAERFFADLEKASSAALYRPVGTIGRLFMAVESRAFDMAA